MANSGKENPMAAQPAESGTRIGEHVTDHGQIGHGPSPAETSYRLPVEETSEAIYFVDQDFRIVDANEATCKLFGYPRDELLNGQIKDFIDPDDLKRNPLKIEELRSGKSIFLDRRLKRKDGTSVSVEVSARMLPNGIIQSIARDVTERRRLDERRRLARASGENEQRLKIAIRMVDMVVFSQDLDLRFTWMISPQLLLKLEQIIGRTDAELLPPLAAERTLAIKRRVLETGVPAREEVSIAIGDQISYFDLAVEPLKDEFGAITGLTGVGLDITKRKRAEQALTAELKLTEAVFKHSVSGLVILDRDYNFVRVNEAYARACRRDIGDFAGRNHFEMYPSEAKLIFDEVVRTKRPFETFTREFVFPDQPGRGITYWDWTLVPILDQQGEVEYLVFSLSEVTERKRAELETLNTKQQLRALSNRLIEVQEEERRNISRELHAEIGQALTAITLQLKTARQSERTDVALIDQCIQITQLTLEQVRDLSLNLRPPHLDDLGIEEALKWLLQRQAQASGWQTEIAVDSPPGRLVAEIETVCFRVAQEALTNAARHARAKKVQVGLRIADEELELTVRDDGSGFDPEPVRLRAAERHSLGLVSMKERTALAGGKLSIRRRDQGGMEILATFPLRYRT